MATITTLAYGTGRGAVSALQTNVPKLHEVYIDLADAVTAKGSALAQADVIEAIKVPQGFQVLFAGLQKITAMTGTSTDLTFDLGVTGGDVDAFVDGVDYDGLAVDAFAAAAAAAITPATTFFTAADTIDILFATQTGTVTGGVVRVFAVLLDCNHGKRAPGIVQLGT